MKTTHITQKYRAKRCVAKRRNNELLAEIADEWLIDAHKDALVLDDSTWKSSTTLLTRVKRVRSITVPQYLGDEWDVMSQIVPSKRIRLRHGTLSDCLADRHSFNVIYMDYCATIKGRCNGVRPCDDVRMLLRNATCDRMVLAVSFCLRGSSEEKTRDVFERIVTRAGWTWDESLGQSLTAYKRTMAFGVYALKM